MKDNPIIVGLAVAGLLALPVAAAAQGRGGPERHGPPSFEEVDADGDGQLTFEEFVAPALDRFAQRGERRAERAADGEDRAGPPERGDGECDRGGRHGGPGGDGERGGHHARMDADGDGEVSSAEFEAALAERFERLDVDGSGTVDETEAEAMRGPRGHHGQRGERDAEGPRGEGGPRGG